MALTVSRVPVIPPGIQSCGYAHHENGEDPDEAHGGDSKAVGCDDFEDDGGECMDGYGLWGVNVLSSASLLVNVRWICQERLSVNHSRAPWTSAYVSATAEGSCASG